MRDQLNLKEKKLQTLQSAIAMLKKELVTASQTIAEKSIRESRSEFDKDQARTKDNKHKGDSSFITDEQVEPLIRRIEALQEVITRMKADHATLSQAEGQLRSQISTLQRERSVLASDAAKHESSARSTSEALKGCQLQLQDSRNAIATLEKKLAAAMKPSSIPRIGATSKGDIELPEQPRRSQTQLLRSRSKNNNPPARLNQQVPSKPARKTNSEKARKPTTSSLGSGDESDYSLDFEDEDEDDSSKHSISKENKVNVPKSDLPQTALTKEEDDRLSDFFDSEDEDSKPSDNTAKNKDNKTHKEPKPLPGASQPSKQALERNPSSSRVASSGKDPSKEGDLPKDSNTNSQSKNQAETEADKLRKAQIMAKWESEKKSQKQIDALKKKISSLSIDLTTATQQAASLKEISALEHLYNTTKAKLEKETQHYSSLSPSVEHVLQLKSTISQLEDEVARITRTQVEKDQQIATLKHENTTLQERVNVSELLLNACRDDMGAKLPQQTKEITSLIPKLQAEVHANASIVLEKDNQIIELRFDKEELRRTVLRLQTRITDLELLARIGTPGTSSTNKGKQEGREVELQGVITALRAVAERLKTENDALKKNSISNSKYMDVVKENKMLKQKVAELSASPNRTSKEDASALMVENEQLKKRLKRETENHQKHLKLIEDHEATARSFIENTKKVNQVQRNLETALAAAQETIRKKEADLKSVILVLEGEKAKRESETGSVSSKTNSDQVERLELQLAQKENDYLMLLTKLEAAEDQNTELKNELSAFDEAFFLEIEELKNNYQKALDLIASYESRVAAS